MSLNKVGNRLSRQVNSDPVQDYYYDSLYQLTYVDYNDGNAVSYVYDALGNRTEEDDGNSLSYTPNTLNQYSAVGATTYSYDTNGNLTDDGNYLYYYDCENRLIDVNDQSDDPVSSYKYDFKGRRMERVVYGSPDATTKYAYDGDQVIAEYDANDVLQRKFTYGPGIDESICLIDAVNGNEVYYYHFDGLGSVVALSDVNNVIVERYSYTVFGEPMIEDVNGVQISQSQVGNPYLFTGRRYDPEAGLYYYRARYYAYDIGRFLQTDSIGYSDGINWYAYVGNNPINYKDPSGHSIVSNYVYYVQWTLGLGKDEREYGQESLETQEMMVSPGANELRKRFYRNRGKDTYSIKYKSIPAAIDTVLNPLYWSSTALQVGGFSGASAVNNGDGTVTYTIPNESGTNSFFYSDHFVSIPDRNSPKGPMRTIVQSFQWTEPIDSETLDWLNRADRLVADMERDRDVLQGVVGRLTNCKK